MPQIRSGETSVLRVLVIPEARDQAMYVQEIIGDPVKVLEGLVKGPLQPVQLAQIEATLLVNEHLIGAPDGSRNQRATLLEWGTGGPDVPLGNRFGGTTVLVGLEVDGKYSGISKEHVDLLMHTSQFRIQFAGQSFPGEWVSAGDTFDNWFDAATAGLIAAQLAGPEGIVTRLVAETSPQVREQWASIASYWLQQRGAPALRPEQIASHYSIDELAAAISQSPLTVGTAISLYELCLVNLADGMEEWLIIHDGDAFTVQFLKPYIAAGTFAEIVSVLMSHSRFLSGL